MNVKRNLILICLLEAVLLSALTGSAQPVTRIAAGEFHSLFLKGDGSLWAMGENYFGQLGDGSYNLVSPYGTNLPEQIVASNVTAIAAGGHQSLFLKNDGSLWVMGWNLYGQLGDGSYIPAGINQPELIVSSGVKSIAAGRDHSLFILDDGSLWTMGYNNRGQLGDGTTNNSNLPEQIVASDVTAIAAGSFFTLFLKSDGSLWAMGDNNLGQLGDGTRNPTNRPELIVAGGVTAIAARKGHSLFLKSDGSLWGMGGNAHGELGDGTFGTAPYYGPNRPEQIVAGPPSYNQISGQLLSGGNMQFSFVGVANANYALDRSFSLAPPNWLPQATNPANSFGALAFTNSPNATTNNFWRIRSVP